jgi:hypothetical protein
VSNRKRGGQPGNLNALKHGFYSKHFQKSELKDLEEIGDLQEEIQMLRVVTRRLLEAARECKDVEELSNLLDTLGLASTRVGGLMRTKKYLGKGIDNILDAISVALENAMEDHGGDLKIYQ